MIPTTSQPLSNVQWFGVGILNLVHQQLKVIESWLDGLAALGISDCLGWKPMNLAKETCLGCPRAEAQGFLPGSACPQLWLSTKF